MKKYFLFSLLVISALTLSACGADTSTPKKSSAADILNEDAAASASSSAAASANSQTGGDNSVDKDKIKQELAGIPGADSQVTQPAGEVKKIDMMTVDPSKFENLAAKYSQAIFSTNMGNFTLKFYSDKAPQTVMNFMNLANIGYYNGVKFHRVIPDFMIQGGDQLTKDDSLQSSWGTGGPGYAIKDEFGPGLSNVRGTISMANAGVNTGGSQFFVNVADNTYLDGKHAVFGEVTEGMDVVDAISKAATGDANRPITPIVINSIVLK